MIEFIFMLTRDDVTPAGRARGLRLDRRHRASATSAARTSGCPRGARRASWTTSARTATRPDSRSSPETEEATLASARVAAEIRPDYLIGGTLIEPVQEILAGTGVQVLALRRPDRRPPVPAARLDRRDRRRHRARRRSSASTASTCSPTATTATSRRSSRAVVGATDLPVICAGSVDSVERIRALDGCGAWAFTIGTAALDGVLVDGAPLERAARSARARPRAPARGPGRGAPGLAVGFGRSTPSSIIRPIMSNFWRLVALRKNA